MHSVALHCQIRIEPQQRRYTSTEEERLLELFGETPRWGDTLKPFLWTHVSIMLPGFTDRTEIATAGALLVRPRGGGRQVSSLSG